MAKPTSSPQSEDRIAKERSMRRRRLRKYLKTLADLTARKRPLKRDLSIRPIHHQLQERVKAHIFISFLSYCLQVTLKARLKRSASGLTPRALLEKFAAVQLIDVHLPTTDGREIVLTRYTQPEKTTKSCSTSCTLPSPSKPRPRFKGPCHPQIEKVL